MLLNLALRHKTDAALPLRRGVVEHVVNFEPMRMLLCKLIKLSAKQDIVHVHIGIDKTKLRAIERVLQCGTDDLEHWGDTRSTGDHANFLRESSVILELALGTTDTDFVTNFYQGKVARDIALLVGLGMETVGLGEPLNQAHKSTLR